MSVVRLPINTLSGGVGRQAPTKRLVSEAENIDNCLVTLEKSIEKRPPLNMVESGLSTCYLDIANLNPATTFSNGGAATNFNTDNLYFHFLDIDGYNRYCIIINRAGYTFDPVAANSFTYSGNTINLDSLITVYRIEPTEWIKEEVDLTYGDNNTYGVGTNTSGFNRAVFEYLTYGNKSITSSYRIANTISTGIAPANTKDTFGSIDFDVGCIIWNKLVKLDYLPDNSQLEMAFSSTAWEASIEANEFIHSGDVINYKRTTPPQTPNPALEDDLSSVEGYWTNVRDDIQIDINPDTFEEYEFGQNLENFGEIPQYPATEVYNDVRDFPGYRAWRMMHHYYDNPRIIETTSGTIDWSTDQYYQTSPLPAEDRDYDPTEYFGLGKVYYARNSYLTFPAGFYRAMRYTKNPYFERMRAEGPNSVFDHRRFPLIIYKDTATDGKWRIKAMPLVPRRAGNSLSNTGPKGVSRKEKIQSMAIWKNRLWIATDNTMLASRTNNYYNFWIDDVQNIVETDPIDIEASVGAYNKLSYIVPFQNILLALSSGSVQFEIRGGSVDVGMSPFNVEFRPTSFFSTSKLVAPQKMANNIFFINSSRMYMYLSGSSFNDEYSTSMEVSSHCRGYLPENIGATTTSSATNTIFFVDADTPYTIYNFTFRTNGDKIIQQAYHKWILSNSDNVLAMKSYEKDFYIVSKRPQTNVGTNKKLAVYFTSLETVPIATPMLDWLVKIFPANMTYSSGSNKTTFTLPYYDPNISYAVKAPEWGTTAYTAYPVEDVLVDNITGLTKVTVTGNFLSNPMYIGRSYLMNIELSQQVYRSESDPNTVYEGVLNLKRITTRHLYTGSYDVLVTRNNRTTTLTSFYPTDINSLIVRNDELKVDTVGEHFVKLLAYSEGCKINIQSEYPTPCNISNIEIIGNWRSRNTSIE
jgi:hypothetical protein